MQEHRMHNHNRLLTLFSEPDAPAIGSRLQSVQLDRGTILHEIDQIIERAYFPVAAMISLVVPLREGGAIEVGVVGGDGVAGASSAINGQRAGSRSIVQIAGPALSLDIECLRQLAQERPEIHALITAHEGVILSQSQQTAACNASHHANERFAKWLLLARDRIGRDDFFLTQEFIAEMLGVRRTTMTLAAQSLQQAGAIGYHRGHVHIREPDLLKEMSCECYEAIAGRFARLFGPRTHW
jgi:CRP-like cAMP-binding protein